MGSPIPTASTPAGDPNRGRERHLDCADGGRTYTVQKGDSLWAIAARELGSGGRYGEIKAANGLSGDTIYPGQVLDIPR